MSSGLADVVQQNLTDNSGKIEPVISSSSLVFIFATLGPFSQKKATLFKI